MAKKKTAEVAKPDPCATCDDTGYTCDVCLAPDGQCECTEGPELVPCTDCPGPGK